jgi:hypothetical protein
MAYDNPTVLTYTLPAVNFGAGGGSFAVKAPSGFEHGRILDVGVAVTETFTAITTPGYVRLGTTTDAQIEVACVAPTGGTTPAGIGTVHITIAWF